MSEFGFQHKHVVQSEILGTGRWNRGGGREVKWKVEIVESGR